MVGNGYVKNVNRTVDLFRICGRRIFKSLVSLFHGRNDGVAKMNQQHWIMNKKNV
jgi:hypothetical protein